MQIEKQKPMKPPPVLAFKLAAPQGFEPRYADPESAVLPLNEGAANFGWDPHDRGPL